MANEFKVKHRAGTAAQWESPTDGPPLRGELVVLLSDAGTPLAAKIGDGETDFADLPTLGPGGFIVYVDDGAGGYELAPSQHDDGITPRWYSGPTAPASLPGHVARVGDVWMETT